MDRQRAMSILAVKGPIEIVDVVVYLVEAYEQQQDDRAGATYQPGGRAGFGAFWLHRRLHSSRVARRNIIVMLMGSNS